jgi:hypothetical protein
MTYKDTKKTASTASKVLALGTALSLGAFGFTAIGTGVASANPTSNTAAASLNTTKVIKLANGKTRIRVDLADNLRGKTVTIRTSRIVNGERKVITLGKLKLTKTGKGVLTVSRKIRVEDRLIVTDGITNIVNSKVTLIDDRTPVVVVPAPPASGGAPSGGDTSTVTASVTGTTTAVNGSAAVTASVTGTVAAVERTGDSPEVQKISVDPGLQVNDEFTVTLAGGTAVTSGAIQGADSVALFADLVAKFQAKGTSGLTFSVGTDEAAPGEIIITYTANGNVVGTASFAQTKRAGAALSAGTAEVQKITLEGTLAINDEYTVTLAGGTAVTSGAIQGADSPALFADLVAKFQAKGTSGLTFSVGDEADTGKIIITYTANGNVEGTASFAQTKKAGVAIS